MGYYTTIRTNQVINMTFEIITTVNIAGVIGVAFWLGRLSSTVNAHTERLHNIEETTHIHWKMINSLRENGKDEIHKIRLLLVRIAEKIGIDAGDLQ